MTIENLINEFENLGTENERLYRSVNWSGFAAICAVISAVGNAVIGGMPSRCNDLFSAFAGTMALINGYFAYRNLKIINENSKAMGRLEKEIEYEIEYLRINNKAE